MLAALGLRYGTPEATEFSVSVHRELALAYYRASVDMAIERGAFEVYDAEREKNNPFIDRLRKGRPRTVRKMMRHGRRNISCLTIAPTGTTSLMTQTTSGIEPVFLPVSQAQAQGQSWRRGCKDRLRGRGGRRIRGIHRVSS